jgi:hypothetical protein
MKVEFFADDPRKKSRAMLEQVLSQGVDQLAIACAFCTAAGIALLLRHASRLRNADSFAVVAAAPPTDYPALAELHRQIPGNLFVHWGNLSPFEKKVGAALMHSKVFYARAGRECWLWTGSHNLTGNATQGGNCEAAVILNGTTDEKPFVDAMQHLLACRNQATLYDPDSPPPGIAERVDILAVHVEADPIPTAPLPWHIQLCLDSAEFDELLEPPADVRLFFYRKGSLRNGWQSAAPSAAFSGSLTGKNLTARNPSARGAGTPAEWGAATFGITESRGFPMVSPPGPPGPLVTTQGIIHVDAASDPDESLFAEEPKVETELIPGEASLSEVDPDMRRFFQTKSLQGSMLVHVPFTGRRLVINLNEDDARTGDLEKIRAKIAPDRDIPIEFSRVSEARLEKRHPFIVRAKYRLRGEEE